MTSTLDDFRTYLPKYLSGEAQENLFADLRLFPENIDKRFYSTILVDSKSLFQGDGLKDMAWHNGVIAIMEPPADRLYRATRAPSFQIL